MRFAQTAKEASKSLVGLTVDGTNRAGLQKKRSFIMLFAQKYSVAFVQSSISLENSDMRFAQVALRWSIV